MAAATAKKKPHIGNPMAHPSVLPERNRLAELREEHAEAVAALEVAGRERENLSPWIDRVQADDIGSEEAVTSIQSGRERAAQVVEERRLKVELLASAISQQEQKLRDALGAAREEILEELYPRHRAALQKVLEGINTFLALCDEYHQIDREVLTAIGNGVGVRTPARPIPLPFGHDLNRLRQWARIFPAQIAPYLERK
jgi:uncharacterized membrane protein YccC